MSGAPISAARHATNGSAPAAAGVATRRVTFVTDIPTPYMLEVLKALAELVDLTVLFCSQTGSRGMPWAAERMLPFELPDDRRADDPKRRRPDRPDYYLSPRILAALSKSRPDAVISFGYSIPTGYAAMSLPASPLTADHLQRRHLRLREQASAATRWSPGASCCTRPRPASRRAAGRGGAFRRARRPPRAGVPSPPLLHPRSPLADRERDAHTSAGRPHGPDRRPPGPHKGVDKLLRGARRGAGSGIPRSAWSWSGPGRRRPASESSPRARPRGRVRRVRRSRRDARPLRAGRRLRLPDPRGPFGIVLLEAAAAGLPSWRPRTPARRGT